MTLGLFDWLRPELAWVAGAGALVLAGGLLGLRRARAELRALVAPRQLRRFAPGVSRTRALSRIALAATALVLLAISVAGPVRGYTLRETVRRGLDLVVCLDTSRSMLATDVRPTRLERARREVRGVLDRLRGDRVALVAFSGDAREVAPLTHDRTTLGALLDTVTPADNRRGGTDLAAALEHALELFDGRTGAHEAVVLLTDGEDLEGRALATADRARDQGIRVYVVGVGTEGGGKIPVRTPDGRESFLVGPDGEEVVTRLDRASLAAIAERTGGEYLSVESSPTPLEDLYEARISKLEGRELEDGKERVPHDRYQWTLALAFACMLAEAGLRGGSSRRRSSSVRFGASPAEGRA